MVSQGEGRRDPTRASMGTTASAHASPPHAVALLPPTGTLCFLDSMGPVRQRAAWNKHWLESGAWNKH
eukprot:3436932-Rhodomonas_salina.3